MVTVSLISFQASIPRWSFKHVSSILASLPHTLITDNRPQFTSELFKGFARKYEFNHIASKLGPNSLTSTSLFPHAQSRTEGHGGHSSSKCGRKLRCQYGGKISPAGVEVKLSYFVIQIPKFASMALLSRQFLLKWSLQKETWKLLLSGSTTPCLVLYV